MMIARRDLLLVGAAAGLASLGGEISSVAADTVADNFVTETDKFVGIQVWDIDRIPEGRLRQDVLDSIGAQNSKNDGCMNGFNFASTAGEKLRVAEIDQPKDSGKRPGMRLRGPFRVVVNSITTNPQTCGVVEEKPFVDWRVPGGGIVEVPCLFENTRERHLRFLFPEDPDLKYKVLYPLVPPNGKMPETRLFSFEWPVKGTTNEWRRMSIHVVVKRIA